MKHLENIIKTAVIAGGVLIGSLLAGNAEAATVSGTVKDLKTRNPVQNVRVYEQNGITVGDTTDFNGNFTLNNVPNGYGKLLFISDDHLKAQHDSLNVTGNQTFNATLPDTLWVNSDSTNSRFRAKANELKDVYLSLGKNPWLWNTQTSVNVPFTISDRFSSADTANIRTALRWLNANLDTINVIKFVEGSDTLTSIYYRPDGSNWTNVALGGGFITGAFVGLSDVFAYDVEHETHHAIGYPGRHVTTYSPSNFSLGTNVIWQPKDKGYKTMGYLLQRTRQDGINNLDMRDFTDTLNVGVEGENKKYNPTTSTLTLNHYPNPVTSTANVQYSTPTSSRNDLTLYDITGRKIENIVDKEENAGKHDVVLHINKLNSGVYFLRLETPYGTRTDKLIKTNL